VVLAMASNDLTLVHVQAEEDYDSAHKFFYWLRIGIAHYHEAATYLSDTRDVPDVAEFVESLPAEAQKRYAKCLAFFDERRGHLESLRSEGVFHYPELKPTRGKRPIAKILEDLADAKGEIQLGGKIRDSRFFFADDVAAATFVRNSGGEGEVENLASEIADAVADFIAFADDALNAWFTCALERGAMFQTVAARRGTVALRCARRSSRRWWEPRSWSPRGS
jgi:hypothetical protein